MYFDVTFGVFLSLKRLFVGETVGENFHLRNSTLTVTILALHGSLSKKEGELFLFAEIGKEVFHMNAPIQLKIRGHTK